MNHKRIIKFIVNWLIILSMPLWILPFLAYLVYQDWKDDNIDPIISGEIWFWEQVMSLRKLIEKIKKTTNESSNVSDLDLSREDILKLCEVTEILYAKHKEIYADGSYKDIASELAFEAISKADEICEDVK